MDVRGQTDARPYRLERRTTTSAPWDLVQSYSSAAAAKSSAAHFFGRATPHLRIVGPESVWECEYHGPRMRRRWRECRA